DVTLGVIRRRHVRLEFSFRDEMLLLLFEQSLPPHPVDRLVAADVDQPRARIGRHANDWPLLERRREGLLQGLLGKLEIAHETDERGEDAARLTAKNVSDLGIDRCRVHGANVSRCAQTTSYMVQIGRTSMEPSRAAGMRAAMAVA